MADAPHPDQQRLRFPRHGVDVGIEQKITAVEFEPRLLTHRLCASFPADQRVIRYLIYLESTRNRSRAALSQNRHSSGSRCGVLRRRALSDFRFETRAREVRGSWPSTERCPARGCPAMGPIRPEL